MSIDMKNLAYIPPPPKFLEWQKKYIKKRNAKIRRYGLWQFFKSKFKRK